MSDAAPGLADRLYALADRIKRIQPLNHRPDAYFEERDEIHKALLREAAALGRRAPGANPRGRFETGVIAGPGRMVRVEKRATRSLRKAEPASR